MVPAQLITFLSFLLELCSTSPVYNMQPAFITTHIGTVGRNIRNLPCVSRRTNEKGICMFAINCLKANGTHLGTCIDKFYFGSCCHIPPVNEIENSIDTDIIPSREPPNRLSTFKPVITTLLQGSTTAVTTEILTTNDQKPSTISTTTEKVTTSSTKEEKTTTESKLSTTFKIQNFTRSPVTTDAPSVTESTTSIQKLSTFLSINGSPSTTSKLDSTTNLFTTLAPSTNEPTQLITKKPKPTTSLPKPSAKPSLKPITKPYTKPYSKPTSKPVKTSSRPKPIIASTKPTKTGKPTKSPTRRPVVTIKVPISTRKPTTTTRTTTIKITTKEPVNIISNSTQKPSTNISSISTASPATVGESITSNEIPTDLSTTSMKVPTTVATTEKPSLVTWTVTDNVRRNTTEEDTSISTTTEEEWKPITTPDGWVLLPSVSSEVSPVTTPKEEAITSSSPIDKFTTIMYVESTSAPPIQEINITTHSPAPAVTNASMDSVSSVDITPSTSEGTPSTSSPSSVFSSSTSTSLGTTEDNTITNPVNMSDFTDVCGRRMYPEARIVGGEKSTFGKWPWQISLRQWRTSTYLHKCGAALLNENWAITAAHCVDNVPPSDLLLRLGEHDLSTESEPYLHQERRVQIVASHPQFDPRTFEYDLALLRFYEPVTFQPNIIPVCVPQSDENFVGRTAHVTGWGRLYEDGPLPSVLQEVSVPVINNTVCESMYRSAGYIEHIPHIFICAGWRRGGYDSCEGDSGGPMVIQREDKRFQLAGVISWGIGCAEPNQPGVYTRISEFRDWINQILQF